MYSYAKINQFVIIYTVLVVLKSHCPGIKFFSGMLTEFLLDCDL